MNRILSCTLALAMLVPMLLASGTAQETKNEGALVVTDPAGDVYPTGYAPVDNPSKRLVDHIDIVEFRIGPDDVDSIPIAVTFAGRDDTFTTVSNAAAVSDASCNMRLTYKSEPDVRYYVYFRTTDLVPGEGPTWSTAISFYYDDGNDWNSDYVSNTGIDLQWDQATFTVHMDIDKGFVPVFPGARDAGKGDTLNVEWLSCYTDTALYLGHSDYIEQEVSYKLQSAGTGTTVTMAFLDAARRDGDEAGAESWSFPSGSDGGPPSSSVAPGHPTVIPIRLENHADEKKLILLDAEPLDAEAKGWNLSLAESIFLKAREVRTVNLIATPPAGAALGAAIDIRVNSVLAASTEKGELQRRLVVTPIFGEDNPTVYFHSRAQDYGEPSNTLQSLIGTRQDLMVSLLETEEGWPSEPMMSTRLSSQWGYDALDPFAAPVRLAADEDATFQVTVVGEAESRLNLYLFIGSEEQGEMYRYYGLLDQGTHTLSLPPLFDEDTVFKAGDSIVFDIGFGSDSVTSAGIDPSATQVTFPARSEGSSLNITDGRFIPTLALADGEDTATYVNPGKEYAFELVLANDGIEEDDLRVTAVLQNGTGWALDILPGSRFRVEPGTSTPVAISVIAGEEVKEYDTAVIEVTATSKKDPNAFTKLTLKATMTLGAEIDAKPYAAKEDQLPPLPEETVESPAVGALLLVGLGLLALVGVRRRG